MTRDQKELAACLFLIGAGCVALVVWLVTHSAIALFFALSGVGGGLFRLLFGESN